MIVQPVLHILGGAMSAFSVAPSPTVALLRSTAVTDRALVASGSVPTRSPTAPPTRALDDVALGVAR